MWIRTVSPADSSGSGSSLRAASGSVRYFAVRITTSLNLIGNAGASGASAGVENARRGSTRFTTRSGGSSASSSSDLREDPAAVDDQRLAGDERGGVARQKESRRGDVGDRPSP